LFSMTNENQISSTEIIIYVLHSDEFYYQLRGKNFNKQF